MKVSVASGKGGTGKTTVAVNLAHALADMSRTVTYADCDVEEPNGHIFLQPAIETSTRAGVVIPVVNVKKCTACGECSRICRFGAIACLGRPAMTFPELCKSCGGCFMVCEERALSEDVREVGVVEEGRAGNIRFLQGRLRVGEAQSPPLIRRVKNKIPDEGVIILDAPPGTSCPVIETARGSDYVLMVTEPTPFGLNDLKLAVEMVRVLDIPFGVGINRAGPGNDGVEQFCREEEIRILFELPDDRRIAEAYSRGEIVCRAIPEYAKVFEHLGREVLEAVS